MNIHIYIYIRTVSQITKDNPPLSNTMSYLPWNTLDKNYPSSLILFSACKLQLWKVSPVSVNQLRESSVYNTHKETDRQTDKVVPVFPQNLCWCDIIRLTNNLWLVTIQHKKDYSLNKGEIFYTFRVTANTGQIIHVTLKDKNVSR